MKKWLKFFFLGFFSHASSRDGLKRGYTTVFLSLVLSLVFIWSGFLFSFMLPFGAQYKASPDFRSTAYAVFANLDPEKRIDAKIENGTLLAKKHDGEYGGSLLINTLESESDKEIYSVNGYEVVLDTRSADTLAEIEAYCVSNDGKNTVITYEEYLTLSDVARLNFDFKLKYTGNALILNDETVEKYRAYLDGKGEGEKTQVKNLSSELASGKITKDEYARAIYELYFKSYYPSIEAYEAASSVPLLRNYYYHNYINNGTKNYLFIFDDCLTGSYEAGRRDVSFYGFYNKLENGDIVNEGLSGKEANLAIDKFIKSTYKANWGINAYACFINTVTVAPFLALMVFVATLLTYSILKLKGVKSVSSIGGALKIIGSFVWFSGVISCVLSVILSFIVGKSLINALPPVLFFLALLIRSIIFAIYENKLYLKESAQKADKTEV